MTESTKVAGLPALAHEHCFKAYEMPPQDDQLYMFNTARLEALISALSASSPSPTGEPIYQRQSMCLNDWTDVDAEEYSRVGTLHRRVVYIAPPPSPVAQQAEPKPLDDPRLQGLFGDCIEGALALGFQGTNPPPEGHWLWRFWSIGNSEARKDKGPQPFGCGPSGGSTEAHFIPGGNQFTSEKIGGVRDAKDSTGADWKRRYDELFEAANNHLKRTSAEGSGGDEGMVLESLHRYDHLVVAAIKLLDEVHHNHDTKECPHKYSVPYGAVVALHQALSQLEAS